MTIKTIMLAFAIVESSNNVDAIGDGGLAYGKYQFHHARFIECGGLQSEWKNMSEKRQDQIMFNAINRCLNLYQKRKYHLKGIDPLMALGTYHNNGHIRNEETAYVKKLRAALKRVQENN